jgi:hypothetical protein
VAYMHKHLNDNLSGKINFIIAFSEEVVTHMKEVRWGDQCGGVYTDTDGDVVDQLRLVQAMAGNNSLLTSFRNKHLYKGFVLKDVVFFLLIQ